MTAKLMSVGKLIMNYDCKAEGISKIIRNYELADAKAYKKIL